MVRYFILPTLDLPVLVDPGDGDQASCLTYPMPERSPVLQDLFTTGIDHGLTHSFHLLRGIHIFRDDAPFKMPPVIVAAFPGNDGIPVMPQRHKMDSRVQVEIYFRVMDEVRKIVVDQLQGRI